MNLGQLICFKLIHLPDPNNPEAAWRGMYLMIVFSIITAIVGTWIYLRKQRLKKRNDRVKKFIHHFSLSDPFWNEKEMRKLGIDIFHTVQHAWSKNKFKPMTEYLSDHLKKKWQDTWNMMQENGIEFIYSQIFVERVTIISVEDHYDNNRDTFSVEISGYIKRYMKSKLTGKSMEKYDDELIDFIDIYTFVRSNDRWLLNEMKLKAKYADIFKLPIKDHKFNRH